MRDTSYVKAIENAEHYLALGQKTIYLEPDDAPWSLAETIEKGGSYRFNGPTCCYVLAPHACGLTFKWSIDFEPRTANGYGVSLFDREGMRDAAMKLPPKARAAFADFLAGEVFEELHKRTEEIRTNLNRQIDSEDCVRGLIAFARGIENAA